MPIDPYSLCPGGTGKKLKFCCADLIGEIDKIETMIEGQQFKACGEHIRQLEAGYSGRACLTVLKAMALVNQNEFATAREALEPLVAAQPGNAVALAWLAITQAATDAPRTAVDTLQQAIGAAGDTIPGEVAHASAVLAQALLAAGDLPAARSHLMLAIALEPQNEHVGGLLASFFTSRGISLLVKDDPVFAAAPDDAPWKAEFDAAINASSRLDWRSAEQRLAALAEAVPDAPAIWCNLAIIRGSLGRTEAMAAALHRYAALAAAPDDAIEAEALAQYVDPESPVDIVDQVLVRCTVRDIEQVVAAFAAQRDILTAPLEGEFAGAGPDQPPPRAAWSVLDRAMPESAEGLSRDRIPKILANALLFGRQTDREARLELIGFRSEVDQALSRLRPLLAEAINEPDEPVVLGHTAAEDLLFRVRWRLPPGVAPDQLQQWTDEQRRDILLNHWPNQPTALFGGRSLAEAAADPTSRLAAQATILLMELNVQREIPGEVFNQLRAKLGLPLAEQIDPTGLDVEKLPLARLARVDATRLSDDDLLKAYRRTAVFDATAAQKRLALEITARPSMDDKVEKAAIWTQLARAAANTQDALEYLDKGRRAAEAAGTSSAFWDLDELALRLHRGEVDHFIRLVQHIQAEHAREPGVGQALVQILAEAGLIGPDGRLRTVPMAEAAATEAPPSGLWTPDQPAAAGKKSAIWTPGMD